jgi:hypothetical protein
MIDNDYVHFYVGEVVSVNDAYKQTTNSTKPFSINVLVKVNDNVKTIENIIPSNANIKQIPILGENVLIYQGYNQNTSYINREQQWYYLTTINIQSNINNNILPTISSKFTPDPEFKDIGVSSMQPFKGDILFEGRWGNTIRLGSTSKSSNIYSVQPAWSSNTTTDPIIILSTRTRTESDKKFIVENIQTDDSSIYLTSKQKIPAFKLNNVIRTSTGESSFVNSQFIAIADRVILKSKSDIIVLDSNNAVELNTPLLSIGQKSNKEYGLHTEQVKELFDTIVDILKFGLVAGSTPVTINPALVSLFTPQLETARNSIENKLIKQDKL